MKKLLKFELKFPVFAVKVGKREGFFHGEKITKEKRGLVDDYIVLSQQYCLSFAFTGVSGHLYCLPSLTAIA